MVKYIFKILIIFFLIIIYPVHVNAAEILQINSSRNILVGDQNRNLSIRLYCVEINDSDELKAVNLLKSEFPRGTKVKIKPFGFKEGILIAKVSNLKGSKDMSELLITKDLTKENCLN